MRKYVRIILGYLFVTTGALTFIQMPLFIHQYSHQLQGHCNELKWQIESMLYTASLSGKSLDQYIQKFIDHPDEDFFRQGTLMKTIQQRWEQFSKALEALRHATPFTRLWTFLRFIQWDICLSTYKEFQPGVPFSLEGGIYALGGTGCGYLLYRLLEVLMRPFFWLFNRKREKNTVS